MMPILMASLFRSALRLGNPHNYVLDKTNTNPRLIERLNLLFLNRSSMTAQLLASTFLGNANYHVTVFTPECLRWGQGISCG